MKRRHFTLGAMATTVGGLGGCASMLITPEVTSLSQIDDRSVLAVGRIEFVPALQAREQHLEMTSLGGSLDPLDQRKYLAGRIALLLGDRPVPAEPKASDAFTADIMNPQLEQTFFLHVPKRKPYVVHGAIIMQMTVTTHPTNPARTHELRIPVPIALGLQVDDRAVYLGTWRFHRDEFYSVRKVEILDHQRGAADEARRRFGAEVPMRKSLARVIPAGTA